MNNYDPAYEYTKRLARATLESVTVRMATPSDRVKGVLREVREVLELAEKVNGGRDLVVLENRAKKALAKIREVLGEAEQDE